MCQEKKHCGCHEGKDPKECTPEQIAECHPEGGHPCEAKGECGEEQSSDGK